MNVMHQHYISIMSIIHNRPYCFLFVSINSVLLNDMHLPAEIGQSS